MFRCYFICRIGDAAADNAENIPDTHFVTEIVILEDYSLNIDGFQGHRQCRHSWFRSGFLCHAASIVVFQSAYKFTSQSGAGDDPRYFQISLPCQPGNSGGALVDERGNVIGIVPAKPDASAALAASGSLPENVNYAVKSSLLLSFLESVPDVSAKLKGPVTADRKFEDVVKSAQQAAVLVLVY